MDELEKAIEDTKTAYEEWEYLKDCGEDWSSVHRSLKVALDALQTVKQNRWIPVSEKYPEPWELVWVTDRRGRMNVCQMSHKGNQDWYDSEEEWMYEHDAIVAWMPYYLPEPYQEVDHE